MPHEHRTPVVPARRLTAAQVQPGDLLAVTLPEGTYPFRVAASTPADGGVVLRLEEVTPLAQQDLRIVEVVVDPDLHLAALARHYGTCRDCGRLSPCPDELAERRLERLWRDAPHHEDDEALNAYLAGCGEPDAVPVAALP